MLAASIIEAQGIDVLGLFFETPFFTSKKARKSAHHINLPFKVMDITKRHLEVVRHPRHGYGRNMNPCIDCHALMFQIAGEVLEKEKAGFVVTGEVLGQRPMSQNRKSLDLIASESGLLGLLLRPLSAKCLPPTIPEERGWVQRELLMGFEGRSRKPQMELARRLDIGEYPSPGGGCLLTENGFSRRLKDLISSKTEISVRKLELLKLGRHFRIATHTKIVVGRNKRENGTILALSGNNDLLLNAVSVPGPTVLISGDHSVDSMKIATAIAAAYSDAGELEVCEVRITQGTENRVLTVSVQDKEDFRPYMI